MKKTTLTPHDHYFKAAMKNPQVAREFFELHLPEEIKNITDLNKLEICQASFIDEELKLSITDILFETLINGKPGYFYLLAEHQSKPIKLMPFRLFKYIIDIMDYHLTITGSKQLPIIYPVIFYTGKRKYSYSTDIFDLFSDPNLAREIFLKPFQLIDVHKIPDETLRKRVWAGIMSLSMKHVFDRDILPFLQDMISLLQEVERANNGSLYVQTTVNYLIQTAEAKNSRPILETIQEGLTEKTKGNTMTIADLLRQEGREEGLNQGLNKGLEQGQLVAKKAIAQKLLAKGMPAETVSQVTELSISDLEEFFATA